MKSKLLPVLLLLPSLPVGAASMQIELELPQMSVAEYHRPYTAIWIEREDKSVALNLAVWYQQERAQKRTPKPMGDEDKATGNGGGPAASDKQKPAAGEGDGGVESGTKWLPDLRQWWRRSGRSLDVPVDGVTGATRPPGTHTLLVDDAGALAELTPGDYRLVVEAAREVGGRELLKLPFSWPPRQTEAIEVQGKTELGRILLKLTP